MSILHKPHPVPAGVGWSGPMRRWFTRCCRCGRFRIVGMFVEQHGSYLSDGWWDECLVCALAQADANFQRHRLTSLTPSDSNQEVSE